jgi:hypothetical protein
MARPTSEGFLQAARHYVPVVTLITAASAGFAYLGNHTLMYNLANLVTSEQLQKQSDKQSEQLQKQSEKQSEQLQMQIEQLRADLRADLRTVPVLEGRTEELSKATAALLASRERRPWW